MRRFCKVLGSTNSIEIILLYIDVLNTFVHFVDIVFTCDYKNILRSFACGNRSGLEFIIWIWYATVTIKEVYNLNNANMRNAVHSLMCFRSCLNLNEIGI